MSAIRNDVTMIATGEMMLCMPEDPLSFFDLVAPTLRSADLVVGHLENPHTRRPEPAWENMLAAPDPDNMVGLSAANFSLVTLAGNPAYSYGPPGIADTIEWLDEHGIAHVGTGMNIAEATRPAILERNGTKFGFLSYDTVGVKENGASETKAGVAYVDIITHYEPSRLSAGAPQMYTWAEPWSLKAMCENIASLRGECDVLFVALHMGVTGQDVVLADYEAQISNAAIDAGADVILGYHCHVLKGIEFYKGKPIFHCLGNLVTTFPWEAHRSYRQRSNSTLSNSRYRGQTGGGRSLIDPEYPLYPFPASSRNALMMKLLISDGVVEKISYLPCLINKKAQPEIVGKSPEGQQVFDYMQMVTSSAGLNARFEWDGDEVLVLDGS